MSKRMKFYDEAWVKSNLKDDESLLGFVTVDSGQLFLCDPSYDEFTENKRNRLGLLIDNFGGDGRFPVVSSGQSDCIESVTIRFDLALHNAHWYFNASSAAEAFYLAKEWFKSQS